MSDWAQDKAREWIDARGGLVVSDDYCIDSLAALLREVALSEWGENAALRAEQTRVAVTLQNYITMWKEATAEREGIVSLMQHRIEIAEAEVARLEAELDRPKHETLRQLADAVERHGLAPEVKG